MKNKVKITARFTRKFNKGHLAGIVHHDSMTFVSVKAAEQWKDGIDKASKMGVLDYELTDFYIENPAHTA